MKRKRRKKEREEEEEEEEEEKILQGISFNVSPGEALGSPMAAPPTLGAEVFVLGIVAKGTAINIAGVTAVCMG